MGVPTVMNDSTGHQTVPAYSSSRAHVTATNIVAHKFFQQLKHAGLPTICQR